MKICEKCGRPSVIQNDQYCYADGGKLIERRTHSCGRELDLNDKFCPRCGEFIEEPYKPTKEEIRADNKLEAHLHSMEGI